MSTNFDLCFRAYIDTFSADDGFGNLIFIPGKAFLSAAISGLYNNQIKLLDYSEWIWSGNVDWGY